MDKTINEIVEGSALPVSIIIAGIGDAEFGQMETLDGDEEPLYNPILKKYAERDIVQFVPLNKLRGDPIALAKQVLAEVPRQMTSYFQSRGIKDLNFFFFTISDSNSVVKSRFLTFKTQIPA